jgi:CheY-like chemotaxis protein
LRQVLAPERELERALTPVAVAARARAVEVLCDLLPGVGHYVLGDSPSFAAEVARATSAAVQAIAPPRDRAFVRAEVCVRVARQFAGFDPTDGVVVSVTTAVGAARATTSDLELVLPKLDAVDEEPPIEGARVLLVIPSARAARIQIANARAIGVEVVRAADADAARDAITRATADGAPFDCCYVDDGLPDHGISVLEMLRDLSPASSRVIATATSRPEDRERLHDAGATTALAKPVLPSHLRSVLAKT